MGKVMEAFCLKNKEKPNNNNMVVSGGGCSKIRGEVVLMKKNVMDFTDIRASFTDRIFELLGKGVSMQLISKNQPEPAGQLL